MEFTQKQYAQYIAALLILSVISQTVYTALYAAAKEVPRQWLWGVEGLVFIILAAIAGAALVQAKNYALGFSAIFASAILNIIQVGIGLTQFGAFREASQAVEGIAPAASSVVALSFFIYNSAKILLGLAAVVFGSGISNTLGKLTVFVGGVAIIAHTFVMMFGRMSSLPIGATGVIATLLLAICLHKAHSEN